NISPHVAVELLQGNEAQSDRFLAAYDAASELVTELCPAADRQRHLSALQSWDDQETGYPDLRLAHVLDMAEAITAMVAKQDAVQERYLHDDGFRQHAKALMNKADALHQRTSHVNSWRKTVGLIGSLHRTGLFDRDGNNAADGRQITKLRYQDMLGP